MLWLKSHMVKRMNEIIKQYIRNAKTRNVNEIQKQIFIKFRVKIKKTEIISVLLNEIQQLRNHGIGLNVLSKTYGISKPILHKLTRNMKRKFDKKLEIHKQTYNAHIPIDKADYFMDGWDLSNGSIRKMHHARKKLTNSPIMITVSNRTQVIEYEIFQVNSEYAQLYLHVIEKADLHNCIIVFDRLMKRLFEHLKKTRNIISVVYGKSQKRPYNTQIERWFGNIAKVQYADLEFVESLNRNEKAHYMRGLAELYFRNNPLILLQLFQQKDIESQKLTVMCKTVKCESNDHKL